ncbi:hypothetical protein B0H17DRAFT_1072628 [Mycena rosella]|uniref:HNH nuclease domain-containing protein n=1 Tax=Mycena rosella TaxID=1033263 RepID=A0AAD7D912_MYCRO|nr:hypothetical protein B0H17DRAFT_1072628 [Mycena rosella]
MADAQSEQPAFRLHLVSELDGLYLDIPTSVVSAVCLYPAKYLRFLGYCILGVDGTIAEDFKSEGLRDEDPLDAGVYYFVREGGENVLEHAVDPEALTYSHVPETTNTRDYFPSLVIARDVSCIFTNASEEMSQGIHIVPFSKGDAWLKYIVEARTAEENENVSNLTTISDIRNGMLIAEHLYKMIDIKKLVVLKTPNRVLNCTDIPPPSNSNINLYGDVQIHDTHCSG